MPRPAPEGARMGLQERFSAAWCRAATPRALALSTETPSGTDVLIVQSLLIAPNFLIVPTRIAQHTGVAATPGHTYLKPSPTSEN